MLLPLYVCHLSFKKRLLDSGSLQHVCDKLRRERMIFQEAEKRDGDQDLRHPNRLVPSSVR